MFDPKTVHIEKRLFFVGGAVARHSTRTTFTLAGSRLLSAKPVQKEPQLLEEKALLFLYGPLSRLVTFYWWHSIVE
ncbi:hypothetical protein [Enterococcus sp. LJL90]